MALFIWPVFSRRCLIGLIGAWRVSIFLIYISHMPILVSSTANHASSAYIQPAVLASKNLPYPSYLPPKRPLPFAAVTNSQLRNRPSSPVVLSQPCSRYMFSRIMHCLIVIRSLRLYTRHRQKQSRYPQTSMPCVPRNKQRAREKPNAPLLVQVERR